MSTYKLVNINNRPPMLSDGGFYADIRFDPSDASPNYIGLHPVKGVDTTDADWKIYKLSYSTAVITDVIEIQLAYGAWDNRASLF